MMNWLIPILPLLLGTTTPYAPCATACRCLIGDYSGIAGREPQTIEEVAGRWDDLIFVGRVVGHAPPGEGDYRWTAGYEFEVEELFLVPGGATPDTVVIRSGAGLYDCGIAFDDGERAIVYASTISETEHVYFTSTCQHTISLTGANEEWERSELARLRALAGR